MGGSSKAGERGGTRKVHKCKTVLITAPKGGVSKTTLARALLVGAAQCNVSTIGIDFDDQASLFKWNAARERSRVSLPDLLPVQVRQERLGDWRAAMEQTRPFDLAVLDTPPGVGANIEALRGIVGQSDYVIIPTGSSDDDLDLVVDWGRSLKHLGVNVVFLLSRVNARTRRYDAALLRLNRVCGVMPISVPLLEAIPADAGIGLTVLDGEPVKPRQALEAVWQTVQREMAL